MDPEVRQVLQREILDRCNEEEREAVERWFKSFQAIGLSKLNGMSVARGTTMSCPLYWTTKLNSTLGQKLLTTSKIQAGHIPLQLCSDLQKPEGDYEPDVTIYASVLTIRFAWLSRFNRKTLFCSTALSYTESTVILTLATQFFKRSTGIKKLHEQYQTQSKN